MIVFFVGKPDTGLIFSKETEHRPPRGATPQGGFFVEQNMEHTKQNQEAKKNPALTGKAWAFLGFAEQMTVLFDSTTTMQEYTKISRSNDELMGLTMF